MECWEGCMRKTLEKAIFYPHPLRIALAHKLSSKLRGFSRDHYLACVKRAVDEALPLGRKRLTVIEFGVAAGKGLIELERICGYLEKRYPISFDIVGFDTGKGLPPPTDYRDTPWKWEEGWYEMDVGALQRKLQRSKLVLGDVSETVPKFLAAGIEAPIGAVMFDLDYFSATAKALEIFSHPDPESRLSRVLCYFDDIGSIDDVGVLRAIRDFNESNENKKIKPAMYWQNQANPFLKGWKIYDFHDFRHPDYTKPVRTENAL